MRNLKRVLSLAMASVMLLGMMVIGAGAVDYKDDKDISYEEAAAVMSAIGVFQGDNNGYFNPKGDLTREAAAKIITYMLMGKDAADGLATSKAPFTDVAANRWSAGSIAYCVQNGIVAGDGQGNFFPEAVVTGSQFGKMLLGALGYQAEAEGLVGSGWEINVAKLVKLSKLNKSLNVTLSRTMTREQAAQMAFNALNANLIEYQGGTKVTTPDGTVVNVGGVRYLIDELFRESNFPNLKPSAAGDETFGRPGTTWKNNTKTVGTFGAKAEFIYTAETETKVVKADLTGYVFPKDADGDPIGIPVVKNIKSDTDTTIATNASIIDSVKALTKNGRAVEIYTTGEVVTDVVVIDTYLVTIDSINTVSKTVNFKDTASAVKSSANADLYDELVDMGKDAKVLVNLAKDGKVLAIAEPETVEGTYTATNKDKNEITVGGTKYELAVNGPADSDELDLGSTYTLYLDAYGYVIGADEEASVATKLAYSVRGVQEGNAKNGYTYSVRLVFTDGTQKWVELNSLNGTKVDDNTNVAPLTDALVSYSEKSDGTYSVTVLGTTEDADKDSYKSFSSATSGQEYKITKNEANFFTKAGTTDAAITDILGNSKTVFLVKSDNSYTAYTGVKNVPTMEKVTGKVALIKDSGVAGLVVIESNTNAVSSDSLAYIVGLIKSEYDSDLKAPVYFYEAVVKGAITTVKATGSANDDLASGLYSVSYDAKGYGSTFDAVDGDDNNLVVNAAAAAISNDIVTLTGVTAPSGAKTTYVASDSFKVFVIDADGEVAVISNSNLKDYTLDSATLILDSTGKFADVLVVVEHAS